MHYSATRRTLVGMVSNPTGAFSTHANYLRAVASEAGLRQGNSPASLRSLATRVGSMPSMTDAPSSRPDLGQIRRSLTSAWGTELLLAITGQVLEDDEVIRIANNWAVVKTYYVLYHAVQALAVAKGFQRPQSHPKTQNQYLSFFVNRPLDLPPWTLGAKDGGWCNAPSSGTINDAIHPWTACSPQTQLNLVAMAYRTTRMDEITDRLSPRDRASRRRTVALGVPRRAPGQAPDDTLEVSRHSLFLSFPPQRSRSSLRVFRPVA
jgi:hypothetical protein